MTSLNREFLNKGKRMKDNKINYTPTLTDIMESWHDIIIHLEAKDYKVAHFLDEVKSLSVEGKQLIIGLYGHKFLLKTLEKDAGIVELAIYFILGQEIKIKFRIKEINTCYKCNVEIDLGDIICGVCQDNTDGRNQHFFQIKNEIE
tara:strand:+ start:907 stop:1344 length:438 start_codon:yes stop_codon:yes gene_type:complete